MSSNIREIATVLAQSNDTDLIYNFLQSILTSNESEEVGKRWALVQLLDSGMSQRAVSAELGLSLCKITRGSKELQKEGSAFKQFIKLSRGIENGKKNS